MKKGTPANKGGPSFKSGDLVFAKVKGYPAWPARVTNPVDEKGLKYHVFFYGTYETAVVPKDGIWIYSQATKEKYGKQKRKGFSEAIVEIETTPDIALPQDAQEAEYLDNTYNPPGAEVEADNTQEFKQEDSIATDDEAPLTIDESSRSRSANVGKGKATKRKAEELDTSITDSEEKGDNQPKKAKTEVSSSTDSIAPTSRSGRLIKPKKFVDEDLNSSKTSADTSQNSKKKQDPRKMWVQVKATGDMLEINLDKDRPVKFDSKDAEVQWERATANNALKFKESVESGQFIPEEIRKKLEQKVNRTPQEEEILQKEKQMQSRKEKVRWLRVEQRLIDLDIAIKTAVHYEHPNMPKCLELLDELYQMPITPLMLKKQPDIVTTIRKLRKYIGPQTEPSDPKDAEEWRTNSEKIRLKADAVFHKIQACFTVPEGDSFWDAFEKAVVEFRDVTKGLDRSQVLHMVADPTTKKKILSK